MGVGTSFEIKSSGKVSNKADALIILSSSSPLEILGELDNNGLVSVEDSANLIVKNSFNNENILVVTSDNSPAFQIDSTGSFVNNGNCTFRSTTFSVTSGTSDNTGT